MRRTLTVLVTAAALMVPATAASAGHADRADRVKSNASCSNGKGGNDGGNALTYNGHGNTAKAIASGCVLETTTDPDPIDPGDLLGIGS